MVTEVLAEKKEAGVPAVPGGDRRSFAVTVE